MMMKVRSSYITFSQILINFSKIIHNFYLQTHLLHGGSRYKASSRVLAVPNEVKRRK